MLKTHFLANGRIACNRVGRNGASRSIENIRAVTCEVCLKSEVAIEAKAKADAAKKAAFEAQVPRKFIEPWHSETKQMVCRSCNGDLFREGDRTCYGHYANFHCSNCGNVESRLTETGMCF